MVQRDPYVWEALISLVSLVAGISISIVVYGADPHIPMLLGVFVAAVIAWKAGFPWEVVQDGMIKGISNSLQAIIILSIIGILIGVWILSGVVPTLLYYGLKILHPKIFLPATVLICSICSLATGTSWGTTGTIGVALIGIGAGLGFPLPIVAGAVLSGAYFGDKMSPLSDTTNLAPAMAGTDLYTHIRHMAYTTGVSYGLTLIIETVLGFFYGGGSANIEIVNQILKTLDSQFNINVVFLLPPVLVLVCAFKKMPAIPGITMGVLSGAILGFLFQGNGFGDFLSAGYGGYVSSTGVAAVDSLLTKGGFSSMLYAISIVLCAMMFGGIMEHTNQLKVIVDKILLKAQSSGSLITATVLTALGANVVLCDQYMAVVMAGRMYAQAYPERGLHPKNLSRAVEDSATVTGCLVPWNSGGAYQSATLGVATIAYLPFAFFNWLSPLVTLLFGWLGITIHPLDPETKERLEAAAKEKEETASDGA
ncbi:MAG: Na+/H+ antiporter NhaC [Desulfobacterales bacterium]|nr:Na+/H+ antiporter NhaC [Desulfobacterales bacterium]